LGLHIGDACTDLCHREVIANAQHGGEPSRHHASELAADDGIAFAMVAPALGVTHDHDRGNSNQMIGRDLTGECTRTRE